MGARAAAVAHVRSLLSQVPAWYSRHPGADTAAQQAAALAALIDTDGPEPAGEYGTMSAGTHTMRRGGLGEVQVEIDLYLNPAGDPASDLTARAAAAAACADAITTALVDLDDPFLLGFSTDLPIRLAPDEGARADWFLCPLLVSVQVFR